MISMFLRGCKFSLTSKVLLSSESSDYVLCLKTAIAHSRPAAQPGLSLLCSRPCASGRFHGSASPEPAPLPTAAATKGSPNKGGRWAQLAVMNPKEPLEKLLFLLS